MWQRGAKPVAAPKDTAMTEVGRALAELGGVATTSEIASALGMHAGNVSRALARLVAAGRVRRLRREGRRVPYQRVGQDAVGARSAGNELRRGRRNLVRAGRSTGLPKQVRKVGRTPNGGVWRRCSTSCRRATSTW